MMMYGALAAGAWREQRGSNRTDGGAHYYHVYETKDGEHVAIGSIEPQFYAELLKHTGLVDEPDLPWQMDSSQWGSMKERLTAIFKSKTRDEWCSIMEGTDVCFAPVLRMSEAVKHPHNVHRKTFIELDGIVQPAPAPRFSETPGAVARPPAHAGQHTDDLLREWRGADDASIAKLRESGAVA
jgi:alpha-methylacyl-CoA racemase